SGERAQTRRSIAPVLQMQPPTNRRRRESPHKIAASSRLPEKKRIRRSWAPAPPRCSRLALAGPACDNRDSIESASRLSKKSQIPRSRLPPNLNPISLRFGPSFFGPLNLFGIWNLELGI